MAQSIRPPRRSGPWTREQFMARVEPQPGGCWRWNGHHIKNGYAVVHLERRRGTTAHRLAYMLFVGAIPPDLEADHLCHNRWCVNPAHLEAVTHKENMRRSTGFFGRMARATHCVKGHPFTPENTLPEPEGRRRCRTCRNANMRARTLRRREKVG